MSKLLIIFSTSPPHNFSTSPPLDFSNFIS